MKLVINIPDEYLDDYHSTDIRIHRWEGKTSDITLCNSSDVHSGEHLEFNEEEEVEYDDEEIEL